MNTEQGPEITLHNDVGDWFLRSLVGIVNTTGISFGITLSVKGLTISGNLIGGKGFFEEGCKEWIMGWPPEIGQVFENIFKEVTEKIYPANIVKGEEKEESDIIYEYIHLSDAKIFSPGQTPIPNNRAIYWRGRISEVDGFFLGMLQAD